MNLKGTGTSITEVPLGYLDLFVGLQMLSSPLSSKSNASGLIDAHSEGDLRTRSTSILLSPDALEKVFKQICPYFRSI